ncbi:NAD(P)H-dependent oxidoreductase [Actinosynnema sp. NPDC002837]
MSESHRLRVAVIIGSTRVGRFGPTVAEWVSAKARRRHDVDVDVIDLAETRLPDRLADEDTTPPLAVRALAGRLDRADGFAVVTPEYNRSFPAPLKTVIDWFCREWQAKPVTIISYGRDNGGLNATRQLREIFTELHATTVRDTVALADYWTYFNTDGTWPKPTAECNAAVDTTLDQLVWWAVALRDARLASPYPA